MTLKTFRRMIEAFFRRWPVYVVALLGAIGFGVMTIGGTEDLYTSRGTVFVESQSLVTSQSGVATPAAFSYLTAAQTTSDQLRGLLQTDIFLASVVERANTDLLPGPSVEVDDAAPRSSDEDSYQYNLASVRPPPDPVGWAAQASDIRESVNVYAVNENLMSVDATTTDPELSHALSIAIIEELIQFQITLDVAESAASEDFFLDLAGSYEQDVVDTRQAVDDALRELATGAEEEPITDLEQREVDRLREAEVLAAARYRGALDEVELARLLSLQTQTDIQQSFSVFDPPRFPTEPDRSLVGELRILISAAAVGLALALIVPIVVGLLQRTVHFPDDLDGIAPVISVVPKERRAALRLTNVEAEATDELATGAAKRVQSQATQTLTYDTAELDHELSGSGRQKPTGPVAPPGKEGDSWDADDFLAEIEGAPALEPTEGSETVPSAADTAETASTTAELTETDQAEESDPSSDDDSPPAEEQPASAKTNDVPDPADGNGAAAPAAEAEAEAAGTEQEKVGTQTETFAPIQGVPVAAPPAPPKAPSPPPTADPMTVGQPDPPDAPLQPLEESAGQVDASVTAEITSPAGQLATAPPRPPGQGPTPPDGQDGPGFTVQSRTNGHDHDSTEQATTSDSGSEADDTTETNRA